MKRIGIVFGGRSGEHDISLMSAASVLEAIDRSKYMPVMIGIDLDGGWHVCQEDPESMLNGTWVNKSVPLDIGMLKETVDFALPVLHGPLGEDGTIQGLFEMMDIPYGGCGVLASAVCMDKAMAKDIFLRNGIPTCAYQVVTGDDIEEDLAGVVKSLRSYFRSPVFVKPANAGSSLGISRAVTSAEIGRALLLAASYDRRILVESAIDGLEVETAVIGNSNVKVAAVGAITTASEFYDYDSKYRDDSGTQLIVPAPLSKAITEEVTTIAKKAYIATDCAGFARVDFFVERRTGKVLVNEINTIPGLTKYSLFPRLWQEVGIGFTEVLDRIIELGYERYNDKNRRQTIRRR